MGNLRAHADLAHTQAHHLGVPSLTFRAWWEAQYGSAAWDALDKIPRARWMDYLRWYRTTLRCRPEFVGQWPQPAQAVA